jgi:iron complex transport system substrate-binding protein
MTDRDTTRHEAPTRRDTLKYGGTIAVSGLLAGCASDTGQEPTPADTAPETATDTSQQTTEGSSSYEVCMEPVGCLEFEEPPERWVPFTGDFADMGVALGQADGLAAIGLRDRFGSHNYEELPGVSVDKDALTQLWQEGVDKEVFYELDADIHVIDPNFMINRLGWSQADVEEISDNVAPFFGNTGFTEVYDWHDYRYYTMYETFENLAELFRERERYEAFEAYHDQVLTDVQSQLPDDAPSVAVVVPASIPPDSFYPYLIGGGTQSKHWRDLEVTDALAANDVPDAQVSGETIDYEALLDIDPDVLAVRIEGDISAEYFEENVRSHLESHDVASELSAVEHDRVFYAGQTYQGPIIHLFQLERAARGVYPDVFDSDTDLFDRQRVADIVTGAF